MSYYFGAPLGSHPAIQTEWLLREALPGLLQYIGKQQESDRLRAASVASDPGRIGRGESGFLKALASELEDEFVAKHSLLPAGIAEDIWDAKIIGDGRSGLGLLNRVGPVVVKYLRPSPIGLHAYRVSGWADGIAHADPRWPSLPELNVIKANLTESLIANEPRALARSVAVRV